MRSSLVACVVAFALSVGVPGAVARPADGASGAAAGPDDAAPLAKKIARDSFGHQYGAVWAFLHPAYRRAISRSHWHRCQRSHPAAPRDVTIRSVAIANVRELPVRLSLLGLRHVQAVELFVEFRTPALAGTQSAFLNTFWLRSAGRWRAVWPSDEYAAYKAGKCYLTPQGPPLY
jgi:hypothetical protein